MTAQSHGKLSNPDLAAVPPEGRTWSKWHIAALWIGMAVCIPTYMLASGMIAAGMTWWQAVLTVLLGNLIVLGPLIANGHGGTKYGVPFPVIARASFGTLGAHIPAMARAIVACGWFGIQTWIGGSAIYSILVALNFITAATPADMLSILDISVGQLLCFVAFWLVHVFIVVRGIESIKWLESYAAPFLIACGIALLAWAIFAVDNTALLFESQTTRPDGVSFWAIFFPQLTAMVGFWATLSLTIPDFTRYCRTQQDQAQGQLIGLPATMTLFSFVGIMATGAAVVLYGEAIWDPVKLITRMGSTTVVVIALIAVLLATLSTNLAANVVGPANGFSNLCPRKISFRTGALITAGIGVAIMPWRLMSDLSEYIFVWLIGYSALLGPIAGIMICDYFVIRRTKLDVEALYDPNGEYAGIRIAAIGALVLSVLPNVPGFLNVATGTAGTNNALFPAVFDEIYVYAWFVGITLAAVLYWIFKGCPLTGAKSA
jgi:NCS1 family nucleobase:cation symporter-1